MKAAGGIRRERSGEDNESYSTVAAEKAESAVCNKAKHEKHRNGVMKIDYQSAAAYWRQSSKAAVANWRLAAAQLAATVARRRRNSMANREMVMSKIISVSSINVS
jgi:hypothetical protein